MREASGGSGVKAADESRFSFSAWRVDGGKFWGERRSLKR
jgi:hypothetical protein